MQDVTDLVFLTMLPYRFWFCHASVSICFTINPPMEWATKMTGLQTNPDVGA